MLPCAAALFLSGCGGPKGVAPPDWDPEGMADAAMDLNDKNNDRILDAAELAAAPGLKAAAEREGGGADANKDGKLSRDEIRDRIAYYEERATGFEIASMEIRIGKQPLGGATVELIPEPFLSGVLDVATGTTRNEDGFVLAKAPGIEGARPGMYRIKVTHPSGVATKYNENTTLGVELIPQVQGYSTGPPVFEVEKK
jgi:hypothetical protein